MRRINGEAPTQESVVAMGVRYYRRHGAVPQHHTLNKSNGLPHYTVVRLFFRGMPGYQNAVLRAAKEANLVDAPVDFDPPTRIRRTGRLTMSDAGEWSSVDLAADILKPILPPHPAGQCTCQGSRDLCPACKRCPNGMNIPEVEEYLGTKA